MGKKDPHILAECCLLLLGRWSFPTAKGNIVDYWEKYLKDLQSIKKDHPKAEFVSAGCIRLSHISDIVDPSPILWAGNIYRSSIECTEGRIVMWLNRILISIDLILT
jgi:hypothetical protein